MGIAPFFPLSSILPHRLFGGGRRGILVWGASFVSAASPCTLDQLTHDTILLSQLGVDNGSGYYQYPRGYSPREY